MFTLAAPLHNTAVNIRFFLGELRPPKPSCGRGYGEPASPMFTLALEISVQRLDKM